MVYIYLQKSYYFYQCRVWASIFTFYTYLKSIKHVGGGDMGFFGGYGGCGYGGGYGYGGGGCGGGFALIIVLFILLIIIGASCFGGGFGGC